MTAKQRSSDCGDDSLLTYITRVTIAVTLCAVELRVENTAPHRIARLFLEEHVTDLA